MSEKENMKSDGLVSVQNDITGYWSLGPKGRSRVDSLVQKLIQSRNATKEPTDEKPVQQGDK